LISQHADEWSLNLTQINSNLLIQVSFMVK